MDWQLLVGGAQEGLVLTFGSSAQCTALQKILLGPQRSMDTTLVSGDSDGFTLTPRIADWVIFCAAQRIRPAMLRRAMAALKPGGHVAIGSQNRWGLSQPAAFRWQQLLLERAGADRVRSFAILPHLEAPRAIVPVDPPAPATVQKFAIEQAWRRISPISAMARRALGVLVDAHLMRYLYPSYLVVGRKPC